MMNQNTETTDRESKATILLVHPLGYSTKNADSDVSRMANLMPPLGLASISAYLTEKGISNDIIDCYAHPESDKLICDYLTASKPEFIGFSCTTSSFFDGVRIAEMARQIIPEIKIIFGGVHVSSMQETILEKFNVINYTIIGEGEEALYELLKSPEENIHEIPGIVFRNQKGTPVFTGVRKHQLNLDDLPYPAYDKLSGYPDSYKLPIFNYPKTPSASCISSRGCPYACSYCDRSVFRRSFRYNSADYLYNHLKHLRDTYGMKHINFYDDQFTFNRKRVETLAKKLIEKPLGLTYNCAARAEHLDDELLKLMKSSGCWMISLGIETGDPDLLAQHRQNADLSMLKDKILLIKQAGIRVKGLLMMGLPGETEESIRKSREYVYSLPLDDFNLAKFTPFPGSPVYKEIKEKGSAIGEFHEDWEKMDCMDFLFIPKGITKERLDTLYIDYYKKHFQRLKVLFSYVTMLWKSPDSWIRFIKNLTGFLKFARTNKRIIK